MKKLVPEFELDERQSEEAKALAKAVSLTESAAKILYARGIDTPEKVRAFLHPSKENFLSPFLMKGMKEAVELIQNARAEEYTVAIFGDYDADGICALSILYYAFTMYGITPYLYVPERSEGYGLNAETVDQIFDEVLPDLFITVDCGISNEKEVRYIQECGAEVIVTDHHTLPEVLPGCVCINPKLADDYPYDNLCGAGVAFKLACALLGERAYSLLDFAAIATVADSVPLLGENRDIVFEGLKRINASPRPCLAALLGKQSGEATAQSLAFTIAPRINAAGRMGDAKAALRLFLTDSETEIFDLAVKLNAYNVERQKSCDELYAQAKEMLREKGAYQNVIMLSGENWSSGFIGIVAARLTEEYNRPTLLFVKNGDLLKGSARSIEAVNIYEALKACDAYIEEFGGHAQAAGINIKEENFPLLEEALDRYISEHYTADDFVPKLPIAEMPEGRFSPVFAKELLSFEPFGVGNRRPLFAVKAGASSARPVKPLSPHIAIKHDCIDFMYFNGAKWLKILESDVKKYLVFECNVSNFRGREYIKGFVREVVCYGGAGEESDFSVFVNNLSRMKAKKVNVEPEYLSTEEMKEKIDSLQRECVYGTCLIASSRNTLAAYGIERADLFYPSEKNPVNRVILSPCADADLSDYRNVLFLDFAPDFNLSCLKGKKVYVNPDIKGMTFPASVQTDRDYLLGIFASVRRNAANLYGNDTEEVTRACGGLGYDMYAFAFALVVFEELGLLGYQDGKTIVYRGVKADLNDSLVYRYARNQR
ncbi:MAG: single-stranded-DNA-specific exonuclease RecJ [Clostridia bacterium]|nr:single-stranded-DNA-specific exonuclease RecJ [Clostridia bacterium]